MQFVNKAKKVLALHCMQRRMPQRVYQEERINSSCVECSVCSLPNRLWQAAEAAVAVYAVFRDTPCVIPLHKLPVFKNMRFNLANRS